MISLVKPESWSPAQRTTDDPIVIEPDDAHPDVVALKEAAAHLAGVASTLDRKLGNATRAITLFDVALELVAWAKAQVGARTDFEVTHFAGAVEVHVLGIRVDLYYGRRL